MSLPLKEQDGILKEYVKYQKIKTLVFLPDLRDAQYKTEELALSATEQLLSLTFHSPQGGSVHQVQGDLAVL